MSYHYTRTQMATAIAQVGVRAGDVVFSHSNIGYFGYPEAGKSKDAVFETILGAFQDVLGATGTLVVPVFTYSFPKRQPFDPEHTPSTCGTFTEMLRQYPGVYRSHDPIFSVAALGQRARELTANVAAECFGPDSFWDRFYHADGIICNLNFDAGSTFIHYAERCLHVPYRYNKLFPGMYMRQGQRHKGPAAIFFCQDLSNPDTAAAFEAFDQLARERGVAARATVGRGELVGIRARDTYRLLAEELPHNPWLLTVAGQKGGTPVLLRLAAETSRQFARVLPERASMPQMIDALWDLPRDIVSDGYDAALLALANQLPMTLHEYPTGTHAWTWIVPEKWTCHEAYLETLDGRQVFAYTDNYLHVVSYSLPFEGVVSRDELDRHLHTNPKVPDAIPFKFKYYERDWGLCCSQHTRDSLTDDAYRVVIRTSFSYSTLKVGEVVAPGEHAESIVLCAHLCHPAMVNDDLSGVVVGIEVMRQLLQRTHRRYTYRLLILPETIGSVAFLSHHEDLIPSIKGGLFLEMLGLDHPHALQLSFHGDTELDRCFRLAVQEGDDAGWVGAFRTIIGNDERQFNAPGVRIPMLSLSRSLPRTHPDWPYREYHTSHDTPACTHTARLEESCALVLRMVDILEANQTPINAFKGEVFLSRYGMHLDFQDDPMGNQRLFDVLYMLDGTHTMAEIAEACGVYFATVQEIVYQFHRHNLVQFRPSESASSNRCEGHSPGS